jgi:hypothetical protein
MEYFVENGSSCDDEDTGIGVVAAKADWELARWAHPFSGGIDLLEVVWRDILLTIIMQAL